MIQIKRNNLDELADRHYVGILQNVEPKLLKNQAVSDLLFKEATLKEILTASPSKLSEIVSKVSKEDVKKYKSDIEKIFYYKGFYEWTEYKATHLAKNLQVNVCPYCNRQYTFTVIEEATQKIRTRPEFDHFLSQSKYPYLALSFYNLIPSCKICNSTFKRDKDWNLHTHIHPYQEGFENNCKFSLKLNKGKGVDFFYGKEDSFEILLKHKENIRIKNNIEDLFLEPIYNEHKDYVREIIQKSSSYSDSYINSLFNQFEGTLFSSLGDIKKMVSGNYIAEEDLDKRVLSKLNKDISEELGIF
jgi:hypothetical protein